MKGPRSPRSPSSKKRCEKRDAGAFGTGGSEGHVELSTHPDRDDTRPLAREARGILRLLETSIELLRASAALKPATVEEAERCLSVLLNDINSAIGSLGKITDSSTAAVVRAGDLSPTEQRALTVIQRTLGGLRPIRTGQDLSSAIKRRLAEDRAMGPKVADLKRAERQKARRPVEEYERLAGVASELADLLDAAHGRIEAALRTGRGRPTGRVISRKQVTEAYGRLAGQRSRVSRAAVARELAVGETTVRRVAPTWPP